MSGDESGAHIFRKERCISGAHKNHEHTKYVINMWLKVAKYLVKYVIFGEKCDKYVVKNSRICSKYVLFAQSMYQIFAHKN